MIDIVRGSFDNKTLLKNKLDAFFSSKKEYEGTLYLGYPIVGEGESIDALWISQSYSIIIFDLYEGSGADYSNREEVRDNLYNEINASLMKTKELMKGRKPVYEINVITIAPSVLKLPDNDFAINAIEKLPQFISSNIKKWEASNEYNHVLSAIQVATKIHLASKRNVTKPESKGSLLKEIENSLATLDIEQNKAVIETVDGLQRIRGLAGSGKTIILALKAAYLYSLNPELKIAITFYTKSLKPMLESFIKRFVWEYTRSDPDMGRIKVLNTWGSFREPGLYSELCAATGIEFLNLDDAKSKSGSSKDLFSFVCNDALSHLNEDNYNMYDVILIDEAQDLPSKFFLLCKKMLTPKGKMVIAYDEMQTLTTGSPLNIREVFSSDEFANEPNKPKRDIILPVCYRNPREVIVTAHAIGFGIYRDGGLVQFFDNPELWGEVGYKLDEGEFKSGSKIKLSRTETSSPEIFNRVIHSSRDIIGGRIAKSHTEEAELVAEQIHINLTEDELQMKDILVISLGNIKLERYVGELRNILYEKYGYNSHIAGVTTPADSFFQDNSITISGIMRAKGNEAAVVYIIGAQDCMTDFQIRHHRNELFTAITRSKMWVRIYGYGDKMSLLGNEISAIKDNNFSLCFKYPSNEEISEMDKVYSDYERPLTDKRENFAEIAKFFKKKNIDISNLSEEDFEALMNITNKSK